MRTIIKNEESNWYKVMCGAPQGSVMAPSNIHGYINYMVKGINSYLSLFPDDAKQLKMMENNEDCKLLQMNK